MKSSKTIFCAPLLVAVLLGGCSSSSSSPPSGQSCTSNIYDPIDAGVVPNTASSNVMPLSVDDTGPGTACDTSCFNISNEAGCASGSSVAGQPCEYVNEPTATVTVCQPGTHVCQTFSNLLVDTGSSGLRIFSNSKDNNGNPLVGSGSTLFPSAPAPSSSLWDCVEYGDGSSEWGQVEPVDVWMGSGGPTSSTPGEVASSVNIQIIQADSTGVGSSYCLPSSGGVADTSAQEAGFTGILGVGLEPYDCDIPTGGCQGSIGCTSAEEAAGTCLDSGYYSCTGAGGTSCAAATPSSSSQLVRNPATAVATDNNGVILAFTGNVGSGGSASVSGYMTLGIGTKSNNQIPSQVTQYPAFPLNETTLQNGTSDTFNTNFSSTNLAGFIDSGSNFYYFPAPSSGALPVCSDDPSGTFYCPGSTQSFSAVNTGTNGVSGCVDFQIANADNLYLDGSGSSSVFSNIGGTSGSLQSGAIFDWGFPFFLGKSVYIGFNGSSASPFWAY